MVRGQLAQGCSWVKSLGKAAGRQGHRYTGAAREQTFKITETGPFLTAIGSNTLGYGVGGGTVFFCNFLKQNVRTTSYYHLK